MKPFISILSGAVLVLAFAPFGAWPLAWVGLVPLLLALEGSTPGRAFLLGYLFGLVFFLGTVYWVVHSMYHYGGVPFVIGTAVMLLLVAYLALYPATFALLLKFTSSSNGLVRVFFLPSAWVMLEYLRGILFTGFPWVLLGYSQTNVPQIVQIADTVGVWGVSFAIMAVNVALYANLRSISMRRKVAPVETAVATVILTLILVYGFMKFSTYETKGKPVSVALVQGNIEQSLKWEPAALLSTVETYSELSSVATSDMSLSARLSGRLPESQREPSGGPSLIVWPETAVPAYLAHDDSIGLLVQDVAERTGSHLLTGAPHYEYDLGTDSYGFFNSAFLVSPQQGEHKRYDKVHLVPFGEYVPLKRVLFFIEKLTVGVGDFLSGPGYIPLEFDGQALGVLICYEAIFPEASAEFVTNGATLLVNITNDAWFGRTSAPYQHLEMARLRAVENGVYLLRAANTGISAVIDPLGRVVEKSGLFEEAVIRAEVRFKEGGPTRFSIYPWAFPAVCIVVVSFFIILEWRKKRRR